MVRREEEEEGLRLDAGEMAEVEALMQGDAEFSKYLQELDRLGREAGRGGARGLAGLESRVAGLEKELGRVRRAEREMLGEMDEALGPGQDEDEVG